MVLPAMQLAEKIPDVHVQLWASALLRGKRFNAFVVLSLEYAFLAELDFSASVYPLQTRTKREVTWHCNEREPVVKVWHTCCGRLSKRMQIMLG